jgi:hypothetical protein
MLCFLLDTLCFTNCFTKSIFYQHDGSVLQRARKPLPWVGTMLEYSCAITVEVCFSSRIVTESGENKRVRGIDMSH